MQRDRLIQNSPPSFELKMPIPVLLLQPWLGHRDPHRYGCSGTSTGTGVHQEQSRTSAGAAWSLQREGGDSSWWLSGSSPQGRSWQGLEHRSEFSDDFFKRTNPRVSLANTGWILAGLLFCFRDYSDAVLDQHLHSLLAVAIFAGALCALLEVFLRDHIILQTFRTSSFLLQGSWLWQVSVYPSFSSDLCTQEGEWSGAALPL